MEVLSETGQVLTTLGEGSILGEVAFFQANSKRTATVRAVTWCVLVLVESQCDEKRTTLANVHYIICKHRCDFVALERKDFMRCCSKSPEQKAAMQRIANTRLASDAIRRELPKQSLLADVSQVIDEHNRT